MGLASPNPEHTTPIPAASIARIERERTVNQRDRDIDVLPKMAEYERGMAEDIRVVSSSSKGLPGKIDTYTPVCFPVVGPAVDVEMDVAKGRQGEGGAVAWIAIDCLP